MLLRGQWGQGLSTGVPSGCCCVANGARACALGCQGVVVAWPMGPGLEHWVAKLLLLRGQWGQGLSTGLPSGCCFSRLSLLVGCCFVVCLFFFAACFRLARLLSSVVCVPFLCFFSFLSLFLSAIVGAVMWWPQVCDLPGLTGWRAVAQWVDGVNHMCGWSVEASKCREFRQAVRWFPRQGVGCCFLSCVC